MSENQTQIREFIARSGQGVIGWVPEAVGGEYVGRFYTRPEPMGLSQTGKTFRQVAYCLRGDGKVDAEYRSLGQKIIKGIPPMSVSKNVGTGEITREGDVVRLRVTYSPS